MRSLCFFCFLLFLFSSSFIYWLIDLYVIRKIVQVMDLPPNSELCIWSISISVCIQYNNLVFCFYYYRCFCVLWGDPWTRREDACFLLCPLSYVSRLVLLWLQPPHLLTILFFRYNRILELREACKQSCFGKLSAKRRAPHLPWGCIHWWIQYFSFLCQQISTLLPGP